MEQPKSVSESESLLSPEEKGLLAEWVRWVKEKAQKVFERRRVENEPRLSLDIFYAHHATPEDRAGLREKFTHTDIYIPEGFYWVPEVLDLLRDASKGLAAKEEIMARLRESPHNVPYMRELVDMVYGSGKEITIIDMPQGDEKAGEYFSLGDLTPEHGKSFEETLNAVQKGVKNQAEFHEKREEYMLANLDAAIKERIQANPHLQRKDTVRVLLSLGSYHTWLYQDLRRRKYDVSRTFKDLPLIFGYGTEADRRFRFHKDISRDLLAKVLLEVMCYHSFGHIVRDAAQNSQKLALFFRKVVSCFSAAEVQAIFESSENTTFERVFIDAMEKKGLHFPETETDIDKFLKHR